MSEKDLASLRAASLDGRCQNVFYKQTQLQRLHDRLLAHASELHEAIVRDTGFSATEAKVEVGLAINTVKERYQELDPKEEFKREYAVTNKENASELRIGVGIVLIKPASFCQLYSVVAPLSAAVAAGNCVLLQVFRSILNDVLLRR